MGDIMQSVENALLIGKISFAMMLLQGQACRSIGFFLLNEAREKLEMIIIHFCKTYGFSRPRMYRRIARKNYLALAKAKKRSTKKIRATIRKQLAFIRRDTGYLENFMQDGYALTSKESTLLLTIYKLYI